MATETRGRARLVPIPRGRLQSCRASRRRGRQRSRRLVARASTSQTSRRSRWQRERAPQHRSALGEAGRGSPRRPRLELDALDSSVLAAVLRLPSCTRGSAACTPTSRTTSPAGWRPRGSPPSLLAGRGRRGAGRARVLRSGRSADRGAARSACRPQTRRDRARRPSGQGRGPACGVPARRRRPRGAAAGIRLRRRDPQPAAVATSPCSGSRCCSRPERGCRSLCAAPMAADPGGRRRRSARAAGRTGARPAGGDRRRPPRRRPGARAAVPRRARGPVADRAHTTAADASTRVRSGWCCSRHVAATRSR